MNPRHSTKFCHGITGMQFWSGQNSSGLLLLERTQSSRGTASADMTSAQVRPLRSWYTGGLYNSFFIKPSDKHNDVVTNSSHWKSSNKEALDRLRSPKQSLLLWILASFANSIVLTRGDPYLQIFNKRGLQMALRCYYVPSRLPPL